ncbi:MAG: hydantoinase/oxoprolinase family protein [Pseudomonadales bacterium]|nr:hydantoinase/oxoprolinase family protein [Pseudomonadales bacterium]
MILGIDTGGTFTDFVLLNEGHIVIHKVLSTPDAPERAILKGIADMKLLDHVKAGSLRIIHGTTIATNAALQDKGVKTVFITNLGFADMLSIGRQAREKLYDLQPTHQPTPVASEFCLELNARMDHHGNILEAIKPAELSELLQQVEQLKPEAVAINLLYSYRDDSHEKQIEAALPKHLFVSRSSHVLPEYKEYERGMATWLNAWLGPLVEKYLARLKAELTPANVAIMQSSGGTVDIDQASQRAVNLLLSGPAGGLAGAAYMGEQLGKTRLITFDMGGTSSDVALIDGKIGLTTESKIGPYPVAVPTVDMHTIGAGGGSVAYLDDGGLLQVGPESAGANPGPACYGRGGGKPTVTDANAVLGRLRPDAFLGGRMKLNIDAAEQAVKSLAEPLGLSLEETALGILKVANQHMIRALRVISVERGIDPRQFTLCCFGGAGGLHVCALAEALSIPSILAPLHGGVLSAFGMLVAPPERQLSRTWQVLLERASKNAIEDILSTMRTQGETELMKEKIPRETIQSIPSLDLRYAGQSYTLNVPWENPDAAESAFHLLHLQRYGHQFELPVELVNIRLAVRAAPQSVELATQSRKEDQSSKATTSNELTLAGIEQPVTVIDRGQLITGHLYQGPMLITEQTATTLVAEGWSAQLDKLGTLHMNLAI